MPSGASRSSSGSSRFGGGFDGQLAVERAMNVSPSVGVGYSLGSPGSQSVGKVFGSRLSRASPYCFIFS